MATTIFRMKGKTWSSDDIWCVAEPKEIGRDEFDRVLVEKVEKGLTVIYAYDEFSARRVEGYVLFGDGSYLYINEEYDGEEEPESGYYELGEYELVDMEEWG